MGRIWTVFITSLILSMITPVYAAPSVGGSTGLINNPTADVLREGQFSAGYYHLEGGGAGVFTTGIMPKVEIGTAGYRYDSQTNKTFVNAKWNLASESILSPGLALGVEDMAGNDKRSFYAVASKTLPFGFRLHAGMGNGRFDGMFAGIEKTLNPISILTGAGTFPTTTLIAEFDGRQMNYGARLSVIPGLKLDAGWRNHSSYFGISFTD